jgi:hypothetical protein
MKEVPNRGFTNIRLHPTKLVTAAIRRLGSVHPCIRVLSFYAAYKADKRFDLEVLS